MVDDRRGMRWIDVLGRSMSFGEPLLASLEIYRDRRCMIWYWGECTLLVVEREETMISIRVRKFMSWHLEGLRYDYR